jgi:hypothetical protein
VCPKENNMLRASRLAAVLPVLAIASGSPSFAQQGFPNKPIKAILVEGAPGAIRAQ